MALKLMGKKRGMTQTFDENGNAVVCTVIEVEPNIVTQIKTVETDGYNAVQTGFDQIKTKDPRTIAKRVSKPLVGHFKKAGVEPRRELAESRIDDVAAFSVGQEITVDLFKDVKHVDATATSIGKGFQGAMKLHNFGGGRASHGAGPTHRHLGSTGSMVGRSFPGGKRASHMGCEKVTVQSLKVVHVDADNKVILVKGAVPGHKNSLVTLKQATKKAG